MTNVREVEHDVQHLSEQVHSRFDYCRLNVDAGLEHMKMDEWKKEGETLGEILRHTDDYLRKPEVIRHIDEVARHLVEARKERMKVWPQDRTRVRNSVS